MYLINITLKQDAASADKSDDLFIAHRAWFAKNLEAGNFLLLGPYLDRKDAGIIIAQTASRAELDEILKDDVYYPDLADYEVREFRVNLISENILNFKGK